MSTTSRDPGIELMKEVPVSRPFALLRLTLRFFGTLCLVLFFALGCTGEARGKPDPEVVLGDYAAEPRTGSHVDTDRLVHRLSDLGANTYMWLVWHSNNDWEDLKVFLPKAEQADITVWVYLVPHSETAAQDKRRPYSEPFRLDYIRWAEEIAKLSLRHTNLKGYVIDDFGENVRPDRFSPDYIRRMVAAGKAINPRLRFYPLMYFNEINERFVEVLAPLIDGVVAAYPHDRASVEQALTFLEDRFRVPGSVTIVFPSSKSSETGDHGLVFQEVRVTEAEHAQMSFHCRDDYNGPTEGYHRLQVRVDDQVMWDEDAAGRNDGIVTVDLAKAVRGKRTVKLALGVFDIKGVTNFGIKASFSDLSVRGFELKDADLGNEGTWSQDVAGSFYVQFVKQQIGERRFRLPLIVMPAGDEAEYKARYREAGAPENIAGRVRMLIDMAQEGRIEGVVIYCLDKKEGSERFEAIRRVFQSVKELSQ